jgi:hypothetical protein
MLPAPPWNRDQEDDIEANEDELEEEKKNDVILTSINSWKVQNIALKRSDNKLHNCLKLTGTFMDHDCVFLIDCGATGDFISSRFIRERNLRTHCSKHPLMISFADGQEYESRKEVQDAEWSTGVNLAYIRHVHYSSKPAEDQVTGERKGGKPKRDFVQRQRQLHPKATIDDGLHGDAQTDTHNLMHTPPYFNISRVSL